MCKLSQPLIFFCIAIILTNFFQTLLDPVKKIVHDISILTDDALVNFLLYGSQSYNFEESIEMKEQFQWNTY